MRRAAILLTTLFGMMLATESCRADGFYYSPYAASGYGCWGCWNHPFGGYGYGYGHGHYQGHKYKDRADEYRGVLPIPPYGPLINPNRSPRDFWMVR